MICKLFFATRVEAQSGNEPKRGKRPSAATLRNERTAVAGTKKKGIKGIERVSREENATSPGLTSFDFCTASPSAFAEFYSIFQEIRWKKNL